MGFTPVAFLNGATTHLSVAILVSQYGKAAIVSLPLNVIPKLLFETRSRRTEWSDAVGLFGLRFGDHVEPVGKKSILSKGQG
jgi:hypothetical protein